MELARFYIQEKETGINKEITFYDNPYISIESTTLFQIIKKFFKLLRFYIFRKKSLMRGEIYTAMKVNADDIFEEHNIWRKEQGLPPITLSEIFPEGNETTKPNYIN